jgi:hypothetical protein
VIFAEVILERIVVDVILLLSTTVPTIANVATLVLVSAVRVQFVVSIKAFPAEATLWVSLESALVNGTRVVVAELLVFAQLGDRE